MNRKISLLIFDLDGTLMDSGDTIYESTLQSFAENGIEGTMDRVRFNKMIGAHFEDIFVDFGIAVPNFEKFLETYKYLYFLNIHMSRFYPGVLDTLDTLYDRGFRLALLTTKGQDQATKIAKHFHLDSRLHYVMGRRPEIANKPSPEPVQYICSHFDIPLEETMVIGDTEFDIGSGKNAGAATTAVTYGYRTPDALKELKPDYIINRPMELLDFPELQVPARTF